MPEVKETISAEAAIPLVEQAVPSGDIAVCFYNWPAKEDTWEVSI